MDFLNDLSGDEKDKFEMVDRESLKAGFTPRSKKPIKK